MQPNKFLEKLLKTKLPPHFTPAPVPWCAEGLAFREDLHLGQTLAYLSGLFYIQEPSAMSAAAALDAQPGERILDLCAAPGGKTTQIASMMQGRGLLAANDASPTRAQALVRNIERAGVRNAIVLTETPRKLAERFGMFFDRVLVDAPCSGEGMFRRDIEVIKAYNANKPETCAAIQSDILRHAATTVRPGGRLVYSTCTFNNIENEGTIERFLAANNDFSLQKTKRIWPHTHTGEGHFVAVMTRAGEGHFATVITRAGESHEYDAINHTHPKPPRKNRQPRHPLPGEFIDFCREFLHDNITENITKRFHCVIHNNRIYLQPTIEGVTEPLNLQSLRTARSGWHAGEISKGRFTPSQALAMGLQATDARFTAHLNEADAWRYARGESLEAKTTPGKPWVLICYNHHPLGWAKQVQSRLKNYLPTGWVR